MDRPCDRTFCMRGAKTKLDSALWFRGGTRSHRNAPMRYLRGLLNRALQVLALYAPGASTVRV